MGPGGKNQTLRRINSTVECTCVSDVSQFFLFFLSGCEGRTRMIWDHRINSTDGCTWGATCNLHISVKFGFLQHTSRESFLYITAVCWRERINRCTQLKIFSPIELTAPRSAPRFTQNDESTLPQKHHNAFSITNS